MRDEALPRGGAAREEGERGADVARRVVEGAAERSAPRSGGGTSRGRRASRAGGRRRGRRCRRAGRARRASLPRLLACRPPRSRRRRPARRPARRRTRGASSRRSGRPPTATTGPPASRARGAEHEPDRPDAEHGDGLAGFDPGALDAVQAAGERLDHAPRPRRAGRRGPAGGSARRSAPGTRMNSA